MKFKAVFRLLLASYCVGLSLSAREAITNPYRTDGFGAQFQTIVYSVIYAELNNQEYYYTPFKSVEHNYDEDDEFIQKKEEMINFIHYFPVNNGSVLQKANLMEYIWFFESHLNACINSFALKNIKDIFRVNKDRSQYFSEGNLHVAIHIRRPNALDPHMPGRTDVPDSFFQKIIESLRVEYASARPLFHIYSEGREEDFRESFKGEDIMFHINGTVEDAFIPMVLADVLVTSPSSFSYIAAILSEGIIYYTPFWHPPLPGWNILNSP